MAKGQRSTSTKSEKQNKEQPTTTEKAEAFDSMNTNVPGLTQPVEPVVAAPPSPETGNGQDNGLSDVLRQLKQLQEESEKQRLITSRLERENKALRSLQDNKVLAEAENQEDKGKEVRLLLWQGLVVTQILPMEGNSVYAMITRGGVPMERQKFHFITEDGQKHLVDLEVWNKEYQSTPPLRVTSEIEDKVSQKTTVTVTYNGKEYTVPVVPGVINP